MLQTADLAMMIMERWHSASRLTQEAYRDMGDIARKCADRFGDEVPDTAVTHSLITGWLKAQPNVEAIGWEWKQPALYLGEPG